MTNEANELLGILDKMDLPSRRKMINKENLLWLSRNIMFKNNDHPNFQRSIELIRMLLGLKVSR